MTKIEGRYTNCKMYGNAEHSKNLWMINHSFGEIEVDTDEENLFIATVYYKDGSNENIKITE